MNGGGENSFAMSKIPLLPSCIVLLLKHTDQRFLLIGIQPPFWEAPHSHSPMPAYKLVLWNTLITCSNKLSMSMSSNVYVSSCKLWCVQMCTVAYTIKKVWHIKFNWPHLMANALYYTLAIINLACITTSSNVVLRNGCLKQSISFETSISAHTWPVNNQPTNKW